MQSGCRGNSISRIKAKDFNSYTVACSLIGKTMCFHVSWRFESFRATHSHDFCFNTDDFLLLIKKPKPLLVRENRESFVRKMFILIYSMVVIILVLGKIAPFHL